MKTRLVSRTVGLIRLGKLSLLVIQGNFERVMRFETVRLFQGQLGFVIHPLDGPIRDFATGSKPVQQTLLELDQSIKPPKNLVSGQVS